MPKNKTHLFLSIVIPTLNNENDLENCLQSIKKQVYPHSNIEILICDGGSHDRTKEIAKRYKCKIFENKKKLAEYGVSLGFMKAKGDIVTILAADNELRGVDFLTNISKPFAINENIILSYPKQVSGANDSWIARYINTFTDPINHFIYGNASNTRTFHREYAIKEKKFGFIVYRFSLQNYPMIALAQGTTIRKEFQREETSFGDDIAPILDMISSGYDLAYVPAAKLVHHSYRSYDEFIRKQRWAIDNYLLKKNYGIAIRQEIFSQKRKIKKLLWPLYVISLIPPVIVSLKGIVLDRETAWVYHPLLTYTTFIVLVFEFIRVRIFQVKSVTRRK